MAIRRFLLSFFALAMPPFRPSSTAALFFPSSVSSLISLVAIFLNDAYRPGVYGVAIYYVLGVLYFAIAGRNRLVLSPEEEFALTQGEHGIPQEEGYSTSREEQEAILGGGAPRAPSASSAAPTQPPSETPTG